MQSYVKYFLTGFSATALLLGADIAMAQDAPQPEENEVRGTVIGGVAWLPEYEGADENQVIPLVAGDIYWGERYLALDGTSLRLNVLNSTTFEIGPVANLTFGRDDEIESASVRALGQIDDAYEVGAFAAIKARSVLADGDEVKLRLEAMSDVSDVHDGWLANAVLSYRLPVGDRLTVIADTSVRFADDEYADTYFTVSAPGATASGLSEFQAQGGIKDIGVSLTAAYALGERWSLVGYAGYRRLLGDFADSPVVEVAGNADQFSAGIGVGMRF
ncbi:MipA/OmpV family protein [Qipengyuania qiaonensis]|uniref:MipA/OmpV family protein n=1 Tax=Qipengyuania qiaonensis TaxID=2867240 RepID=A0ABS7J6N0_9SPHN|nr:MipA/OmpV family protein [Qipengyuania qiaonensis]MBX7481620.1 MipA/OmpV family protein [Qipengyuania qiaonensis]